MKIRVETNEIEITKNKRENSQCFQMTNKISKPLARLIEKKERRYKLSI
jgi:hypothetical protein